MSQSVSSLMSTHRVLRFCWRWFKTALLFFLVIVSALLLLVLFLLIFRVPSFEIGNSDFWLLRWQNPPGVPFSLTWNLALLLAIATIIGFIQVLLVTRKHLN